MLLFRGAFGVIFSKSKGNVIYRQASVGVMVEYNDNGNYLLVVSTLIWSHFIIMLLNDNSLFMRVPKIVNDPVFGFNFWINHTKQQDLSKYIRKQLNFIAIIAFRFVHVLAIKVVIKMKYKPSSVDCALHTNKLQRKQTQ